MEKLGITELKELLKFVIEMGEAEYMVTSTGYLSGVQDIKEIGTVSVGFGEPTVPLSTNEAHVIQEALRSPEVQGMMQKLIETEVFKSELSSHRVGGTSLPGGFGRSKTNEQRQTVLA